MSYSGLTPEEAAERLLERKRLRTTSLEDWCVKALPSLVPDVENPKPARHHRLLIQKLEDLNSGRAKRLMIFMPPGSAKSGFASVLFPAWCFAQGPGRSIIGASHTADLATNFSRKIQNIVRAHDKVLGYGLASESAELWNTTNSGQYRAAGVGGPIAGFRADIAIVDDPTKSREQAESKAHRDRTFDWFGADLQTRCKPNAKIVAIGTRYHEDDLFGRLLEQQGHLWDVLKLPAIAGENDPLGREPGEPLWGDDAYGYAESIRNAEKIHGARDWFSLFQQEPRTLEGGVFRTERIGIFDTAPAGLSVVRAWDLAATEQAGTRNPDWTVGLLLGRTFQGTYIVLDVVRFRGGPDEVEQVIIATAQRDGRRVPISLPQDPGSAGKFQASYLVRQLAGHRVLATPETGDKATRAGPIASQVNTGNLALIQAPWNIAFLDELQGFPSGKHDDQTDALSRAFSYLLLDDKRQRFAALS